VKGSYTQLLATTAFNASGIHILARDNNATASPHDYLLDLSIGASGQEQVVISNLLITQTTDRNGGICYFPISIPSGSRLAARTQCNIAGTTLVVAAMLHSQSFMSTAGCNRVTTYGAATADSGGEVVDPGAVAHTKGAYAQITASTTAPIRSLVMCLGNRGNSAMAEADFLFDIAIGASGQEQVVVPNIWVSESGAEIVIPRAILVPVTIPTGTRLAVRAQCSETNATDRLLDVVIYGLD
jgi:hypothetical protein